MAETTTLVPPAFESLLNRLRDLIVNGGYSPPALAMRDRGVSFVAPFEGRERLLQAGGEPAPITLSDPLLETFIFRQRLTPLAYGYPVYLDPSSGELSPLFFCAATLRLGPDGKLIAERIPRAATKLNRRLLIQLGWPKSATVRQQRELNEPRPTAFADSLSQLCGILGVEGECDPQAMTRLPMGEPVEGSPAWVNAAILFATDRATADNRLLQELKLVEQASQLDACVLGAIERSPTPDAGLGPLKLPLAPIPLELMGVLATCLGQRYSVVEAPPGGGKYALIVDLLASACASRVSTLYVASRRTVLEQVSHRLQSLAEVDQPCIIPLQGPEALQSRILAVLKETKTGEHADADDDDDDRHTDDIAEQLSRMQAVADGIAPLRSATDQVIDAQATRIAAECQRRDAWSALFNADHDIAVDTTQLAQWEAEAAELAALQHGERDDARVLALTRSLHDALIPVPEARKADLPIELSGQEPPETAAEPDALAKAFSQLRVFVDWRAAALAERHSVETWLACPATRSFLPRLGAGQQAASRASARVLSRRRRTAIERAGPLIADKVREVFQLASARRAAPTDAPVDADSSPLIAAIADAATALPLWTAEAGQVQEVLPATPGLFDLVVVDDAEELDGAALLTILLRARSAVVFGSLIHGDRDSEDDGLGVALSLLRQPPMKIAEHRRCHPRIALYISETFHGGGLRILLDRRMMLWDRHYRSLAGVQWHRPTVARSPADDEADDVVRLVGSWKDAGVFDGDRPFSLAVVTPFPERSETLGRALRSVLSDDYRAKSLVVGGPETLRGRITDLLVLLPGLSADMPPARASLLASNPVLYHDAVGTARIGVHVIADEILCRQAGGPLADLLSCAAGSSSGRDAGVDSEGSEATETVLGMAKALDLHTMVEPDGTIIVFTPFGRIYRLTIGPSPGSAGWDLSSATPRPLLRLDPNEIEANPERIRAMLARLA